MNSNGKVSVYGPVCGHCGRENKDTEVCTAKDCPGVRAILSVGREKGQ